MMDPRMWLSLKLLLIISGSLFQTAVDSTRLDYDHLEVENRYSQKIHRNRAEKPFQKLEIETTFEPASCLLRTQANDRLAVTYVGTFPDTGKRFDAIEDPKKPFTFQVGVGQVIKGWDQGMLNMCEGERRILKIPSDLAYGHRGAGDDIPPDSPLMFEVELIKILSRKYESTTTLKKLLIETIHKPTSCSIKSKNGDRLAMIYVGTLRSTGLQFDAAKDPKHPFEFKLGVGQVIQGWDEGLKHMCIGEKRRLSIPALMAYGAHGFESGDPPIPANADLVFDTELVDIRSHQSDTVLGDQNNRGPWIWTWLWLVIEASINLIETFSIFS